MKQKRKKIRFSKRRITAIILVCLALALLMVAVSGDSVMDMLRERIVDSHKLISETGISYTGDGSDVPAKYKYWVTKEQHAAFEQAILEARAFVEGADREDYLEVGGVRISMIVEPVPGMANHVDISLHLDGNPGIYAFVTDLVFCTDTLTPVSITGHDEFETFRITTGPLYGGVYEDRRLFLGSAFNTVSRETGKFSTMRFKVADDYTSSDLPVVLGHIDVTVYAPGFPYDYRLLYVATGKQILSKYGLTDYSYDFDEDFYAANVRVRDRGMPGDLDGDGRRTSADATLIVGHFVNPDSVPFSVMSDVDGDGIVTMNDATHLERLIAGWDVSVPRLNMGYRILVNSAGGQAARDHAIRIMDGWGSYDGVRTIFEKNFKINLIRVSVDYESSLNIGSGCRAQGNSAICTLPPANDTPNFCGRLAGGSDCGINHHRRGRNLKDLPAVSSNINTFRFVDFRLCAYYSTPPHPGKQRHDTYPGFAELGGRDMIVSLESGGIIPYNITVHEITHLLGPRDNQCVGYCVIRGDLGEINWCNNCRRIINEHISGFEP